MTKKKKLLAAPHNTERGDEKSIGYLSRHMYRMFAKSIAAELAPFGLAAAQWSVLRVLWGDEGLSQVDLADRMRVEKASLTTVLEAMDRQGLISRDRNINDRRKVNIYLTSKSRQMKKELIPFVSKINRKATRGMSSEETEALRVLMSKVIANLDS